MKFTLTESFASTLATYQRNGVIYLRDFVSPQQLPLLLAEINTIESDAEKNLQQTWNNKRVCF